MQDEREAWEAQYSRKGEMWRGVAEIPFSLEKDEDVLELGCGNGKTAQAIKGRGADLVCLDISRNALNLCHTRTGPLVLVQGDASALPFRDMSFDLVVCHHVMDHLDAEERSDAVVEMRRLLRPGGRIAFQGFSIEDMRYGKGVLVAENTYRRGDGISYHYFRDDEVLDMFRGFDLVDMRHRTLEKVYHGQRMRRDVIQAEFTV